MPPMPHSHREWGKQEFYRHLKKLPAQKSILEKERVFANRAQSGPTNFPRVGAKILVPHIPNGLKNISIFEDIFTAHSSFSIYKYNSRKSLLISKPTNICAIFPKSLSLWPRCGTLLVLSKLRLRQLACQNIFRILTACNARPNLSSCIKDPIRLSYFL